MRKITGIIILLLLYAFASAQTMRDSLEAVLQESKGREKVHIALELGFMSRVNDFSSASGYAETALRESRRIGDEALEASALYHLGMANYYHSYADTAMVLFEHAVRLAKVNNNDSLIAQIYHLMGTAENVYYSDMDQSFRYFNQGIHYGLVSKNYRALGAIYSSISNIFRVNGSYEKALEFIYRAKENYERANFREGEAWINYLTGILYNTLELYEEALEPLHAALDLYRDLGERTGNMTGVAICLDQLAIINSRLGNIALAREYNTRALELHREGDSKFGISNSLKYKAGIELRDGNYDIALTLLDSSLHIKISTGEVLGYASIYELYGRILKKKGMYRRAIDSLQQGMRYAEENGQLRFIMDMSGLLAGLYYDTGDTDKAYRYQSRQMQGADSLYSAKSTRNMLHLESYFKTRKTEEEIHRLEQENLRAELSLQREKQISTYLIGILILSFVIIMLFVFLFLSKIRTNRTLEANKRAVDEANATKDKFFSIIAHDLRSPFNSILGMASLIKEKESDLDGKEIKMMLSTLHDSAEKSYTLLNNLLQWANSQSGRMPFSPEKIRLRPVIHEVTDLLKSNFSQKNVKLIDAVGDLRVYADKNMLQTILRNLLSNAVKYSRPGGNVRIGTEDLRDEVLISVSDSGIGIPECEQEHLFHLTDAYQIPGTAGEKGSGLGLVICKEFTERHGGRIWVESETGKGSTFYVSLPKKK